MAFSVKVYVSQERETIIEDSTTKFKVGTEITGIDVTDGASQGSVGIDKYFFIMGFTDRSSDAARFQVPGYGTYVRLVDPYDLRDDQPDHPTPVYDGSTPIYQSYSDYIMWDYDTSSGEHTLYEYGNVIPVLPATTVYNDVLNYFVTNNIVAYRSSSLNIDYTDVAYAILAAQSTQNSINAFAKVYEEIMENVFSTKNDDYAPGYKETFTFPSN